MKSIKHHSTVSNNVCRFCNTEIAFQTQSLLILVLDYDYQRRTVYTYDKSVINFEKEALDFESK